MTSQVMIPFLSKLRIERIRSEKTTAFLLSFRF